MKGKVWVRSQSLEPSRAGLPGQGLGGGNAALGAHMWAVGLARAFRGHRVPQTLDWEEQRTGGNLT